MKRSFEIEIDGKLIEKVRPIIRKQHSRVPKKRVRELYSKEKPDWLFGGFEDYKSNKLSE